MTLYPAQEPHDPINLRATEMTHWDWLEEIWYFFGMLLVASAMMAFVVALVLLRAYGKKQAEECRREELRQEIRTEVKAQLNDSAAS